MKLLPFIFMFFFSCNSEKGGPDAALSEYIMLRFSSENPSKDKFLKRLTGDLYDRINSMDDEKLEGFSKTWRLKKGTFKITASDCKSSELCYLTYSISYDTYSGDTREFLSEIKEIATLKYVDGMWKISEVSNIKTYHEGKKEIEVLN